MINISSNKFISNMLLNVSKKSNELSKMNRIKIYFTISSKKLKTEYIKLSNIKINN